jgi:cell division protein FtsA
VARSSRKNEPIAALDVGSAKIACFIAKMDDDKVLRVLGAGHNRSQGVRSGQVVDMAALQSSINEAVSNAEKMAGVRVKDLMLNIAGPTLLSRNMEAEVAIPHNHPVRMSDVRRVLDQGSQLHLHAAQAAHHGRTPTSNQGNGTNPAPHHSTESEVIHRWSNGYTIDGSDRIIDPRGMYGNRLGVRLHMVSVALGPLRNVRTVIEHCQLDIAEQVATPHASALACAIDDEKEMGVTVIDMGAGTTSVSIFMDGHPLFADCIPVGGQHVTSDLSKILSTPLNAAERLKTVWGSVLSSPRDANEMLRIQLVGEDDGQTGGHEIPRSELVSIIRARLEETFELVRARLADTRMLHAAGRRVVLTGGASQLQGVREMAELILDKQVRLGRPRRLKGLPEAVSGPAFASCAGLLRWATQDHVELGFDNRDIDGNDETDRPGGALLRVGHWIKELLG